MQGLSGYGIVALFIALVLPLPAEAQVKVIISGGFSRAYQQLLPDFERSSGIKVATGSGASQGNGPQTIGAQLARGEAYDVVILSREGLTGLIGAQRIAAGTGVDLARIPLGIGVRAGAPKPDVGTVEAFKRAVTGAKLVAMPASTSGIFLTQELFPRLGIAEQVRYKLAARGSGATAMVASGEADLAVMPVSEILDAPGVDFAGTIAAEVQFIQTFSAAIVASSKQRDAAKRLIDFLSSAQAATVMKQHGMEPVGRP